MTGIYKIENLINHKIYIGQSGDIIYRWYHHRSDLRGGYHHNRHLQWAWQLYGEENFYFDIVEECSVDLLNEREKYWIQYFKSNDSDFGYNLDDGGLGIRGYKHTQEELNKMHRIQSPNIILQFDLNFILVNEWIGGSSQIRKEFGATKESIDYRCAHKIKEMSPYKGFYWVYKEEYNDDSFNWDRYLNNEVIKNVYKPSEKMFKEPICQYNFDKELIGVYNSASELESKGFSYHIIGGLVNHKLKCRTYKNSIWCYQSYDFSDGFYDNVFLYKTSRGEGRRRPILQLDPNTREVIREFASQTEAGKFFNVDPCCISRAINSNLEHKSLGYLWQFKQ